MSVLKDARNLILGNGDVFLEATVGALPSFSTYKAALAGGTLGSLGGNVGAIKGTATVQIVREIIAFETGVPQQTADQTVIREGLHFKCALAELSLATIQQQIGGGVYSTLAGAATLVTAEPHTISALLGVPIALGPVVYTTSTPAATADPVLTLTGGVVTGASVPCTATATGTGTLVISGAGNVITAAGVTVTVGGTYADGQIYTLVFGNGLYTVSYTSQSGDANNSGAALGLAKALRGVVATGAVSSPFVTAAVTAPAPGAAIITVTLVSFLQGYDYIIDNTNNVLTALSSGNLSAGGSVLLTYYYGALTSETLTGGGQASVTTTALRFFHPYKDGRILALTVFKGNPAGGVTLPFEEIAYSFAELEFRAIADFTKTAGDQLYELYRELPQ